MKQQKSLKTRKEMKKRGNTHLRGGKDQSIPKGNGEVRSWRCFRGLLWVAVEVGLFPASTSPESLGGVVIKEAKDKG